MSDAGGGLSWTPPGHHFRVPPTPPLTPASAAADFTVAPASLGQVRQPRPYLGPMLDISGFLPWCFSENVT